MINKTLNWWHNSRSPQAESCRAAETFQAGGKFFGSCYLDGTFCQVQAGSQFASARPRHIIFTKKLFFKPSNLFAAECGTVSADGIIWIIDGTSCNK